MSHHYSGPNLAFPRGDARLDFTDLYAFPKPGDPDKSILIMNVHPSASASPPGPTTAEPFSPDALYDIKIDTNGDAVADITYQVRFTSFEHGTQTATLRRQEGVEAAAVGEGGQLIVDGAPVSMGSEPHVTRTRDYVFFAGWRSDPFFIDAGALNNFQLTGKDFFADADVCSIALELSNVLLGSKEVHLWARILARNDGERGGWIQVERGARASQMPFLSGDQNEAYGAAEPAGDARFISVFAHSLEHTGGFAPEEAKRLAGTFLPDLLRYDSTRPASYPDNGRTLSDDAAGSFLSIVTSGKVKAGALRPHADLVGEFPYLGPPHTNRSTDKAGQPSVKAKASTP
jgi:hypothetical protein